MNTTQVKPTQKRLIVANGEPIHPKAQAIATVEEITARYLVYCQNRINSGMVGYGGGNCTKEPGYCESTQPYLF